jgi:23S rRNA pseudouridine1911/1915/1917 synthase
MAVHKAPGVLTVSHPGSRERCLLDDLRRDGHKVAPVHRLDKETSGVLLLCLAPAIRSELIELFRQREVGKRYLAVVRGRPASTTAVIEVPILDQGATARVDRRGKHAVTRYEVIEQFDAGASLLRVTMETGRHNQIRVHLAHIGHPLLGDRKFGRRLRRDSRDPLPSAPRTLLHAERLVFKHPGTHRKQTLRCSPPDDFEAVLQALRASPPP